MGAVHNTHGKHGAQHLKTNTRLVNKREGGEKLLYILERLLQKVLENWNMAKMLTKLDQVTFLRPRLRVRTLILSKGSSFCKHKMRHFTLFKSIFGIRYRLFLSRNIHY